VLPGFSVTTVSDTFLIQDGWEEEPASKSSFSMYSRAKRATQKAYVSQGPALRILK